MRACKDSVSVHSVSVRSVYVHRMDMYYVVNMALGVPGQGVLRMGMPGGNTRARAKRDSSSAVKNINS